MNHSLLRFSALYLSPLALLTALSLRADTIAYEGFNYAPVGGQLSGANGGAGFSSAWATAGYNAAGSSNYQIAADGLNFGTLPVSGQSVSSAAVPTIAGIGRGLSQSLGADNITTYFSFLLQPQGTLNAGAFNGFFGLDIVGSAGELFIGKPGAGSTGQYVLETRGGGGQVSSGVDAVVGATAFLVVKANFLPGDDTFTLYVDPVPGDPEPATGTVKNDLDLGTVNSLIIYSTGAFTLDEIAVGDSFASVTGAPEPYILWPLAMGVATLMIARRKNRGC